MIPTIDWPTFWAIIISLSVFRLIDGIVALLTMNDYRNHNDMELGERELLARAFSGIIVPIFTVFALLLFFVIYVRF